jgi:large subunit ribosomal protein L25
MSTIKITGETRDAFGKGAARQTRRAGLIPAVVYGRGSGVTHIALPERELGLALRKSRVVLEVSVGGETFIVAPRDVQRDPVRRNIEHLDLVLIDTAEVASRAAEAQAMAAAEAAAVEAGLDPIAAAHHVEDAVAHGESAEAAASHAVADMEQEAEARADAAEHANEALDAADAATAAAASAAAAAVAPDVED